MSQVKHNSGFTAELAHVFFSTGSKIYISQVWHLQSSSHTIPYVGRRSGKILGSSILLE